MLVFIVLTFIFLWALKQFWSSSEELKKTKRWAKADDERSLMVFKLKELLNDPAMMDCKWKEWLPVFEFVDEYYQQHNYFNLPVFRLADVVRNQIDN